MSGRPAARTKVLARASLSVATPLEFGAAPALCRRPVRVADVAVWYGARSGGVRTYLDAKARVAQTTGAFEHHLVVPAAREHHGSGRHELPGVTVGVANGYRMPLDARRLVATLRAVEPDVVMLHDANWWPATVVDSARALGAAVIAVHHGTAAATAIGKPGPQAIWRRGLSAMQRRLYRRADAVMAAGAAPPEAAGVPHIPLRFGVDDAFRPPATHRRRNHVLYAGRLAPEKGVDLLLEAMVPSPGRWELHLVGHGPAEGALRRQATQLGVSDRVQFLPFIESPHALARAYAEAGCVVVPGSHETFGLVTLEAAASGAAVVASSAVPAAHEARGLVHLFAAGDARALAATIDDAVIGAPDLRAAAALSGHLCWRRAFVSELRDIQALVG